MGAPQFTTPTFILTFTDETLDLTAAQNVYVTFSQNGNRIVTKTGNDLTVAEKTVSVKLTQKECGTFVKGNVKIQVNWTMRGGGRAASNIVAYHIDDQLLREVVE